MLKISIACRVGRFMAVVVALIAVALTLILSFTLGPTVKSTAVASAPSGGAPSDSAKSMQSGRWQRYGLTGTNLQDVDLVSPADGWVVGTDGLLAHWDGQDWRVYDNLDLGTRNINEIEMLASDQAWAALEGGKILRYDGTVWAFETSEVITSTMHSLSMLSRTEGWGGGEGGILARYNGTTWEQVPPAPGITSTIWGLDMVSPTDGWAVTGTSDQSGRVGRLIHFDGVSWQQYAFTADRTLYDVDMLDGSYGWAVGSYGLLLEWENGAWSYSSSPTGGTFVKVFVYSRTEAWAASVDGSLAHWDGQTWSGAGALTGAALQSVCMLSGNLAWAVGDAGTIYKYDGAQWTVIESYVDMRDFYGLDFLDTNDGWAVGYYSGWDESGLWHWDGTRWVGHSAPLLFEQLQDVDMVFSDAVWAVGRYGHILRWNGTIWLTDTISSEAYFRAVSMISPTDGWAVGYSSGHPARILHYDGTAWSYATYPHTQSWSVTSVEAVGPNDVWIGGWIDTNTGVLVHYDGATWVETITDAPIQAISMVAANEGWAAGGGDGWGLLLHYLNGTWTQVDLSYTGSFFDVDMLNGDEGWIVGRSVGEPEPEAFFHYYEGRWIRLASPTGRVIMAVRSVNSTLSWAVTQGNYGYGGLIYFEGSGMPHATPTPTVTATGTGTITATVTSTPQPCSISFTDVAPADYFYEAVRYLYCRGVISGYTDNTFRPYNNSTRGQLCKIVVLAEGWPINTTGGPHFTDVPAGHPFYAFVETAYRRGVVSGYEDDTFRPMSNVTRAQLTKITVLAEAWPIDTTGGPHFLDAPPDHPFYTYIETAYNRGIILGYSDNNFRPGNSATRGQIAKIVYLAVTAP